MQLSLFVFILFPRFSALLSILLLFLLNFLENQTERDSVCASPNNNAAIVFAVIGVVRGLANPMRKAHDVKAVYF
jgi:uncharacterized membrane protein YjfL (UPF0719 family)